MHAGVQSTPLAGLLSFAGAECMGAPLLNRLPHVCEDNYMPWRLGHWPTHTPCCCRRAPGPAVPSTRTRLPLWPLTPHDDGSCCRAGARRAHRGCGPAGKGQRPWRLPALNPSSASFAAGQLALMMMTNVHPKALPSPSQESHLCSQPPARTGSLCPPTYTDGAVQRPGCNAMLLSGWQRLSTGAACWLRAVPAGQTSVRAPARWLAACVSPSTGDPW